MDEDGPICCNGVLVVCCSSLKPEEIILQIIGTGSLPEPAEIDGNVKGYPWHVETKYYSADANLYAIETKDLVSASFADSIQAVVIHFDSKEVNSFKNAQSWMPFVKNFDPQVQLLACNNCSGENENLDLTRIDIIDWCLKNQFELVELCPDEDSDEEDDFKETKGYDRIIQALQAHPWLDLTMKDAPSYQPSQQFLDTLRSQEDGTVNGHVEQVEADLGNLLLNTEDVKTAVNSNLNPGNFSVQSEQAKKQARLDKIDSLIDEDRWLFGAIGNEDPGDQSFESLFDKFRDMKDKASSLPGDERRLYAEKVAIAFWRAMGGDEDEVAGLSSDEN